MQGFFHFGAFAADFVHPQFLQTALARQLLADLGRLGGPFGQLRGGDVAVVGGEAVQPGFAPIGQPLQLLIDQADVLLQRFAIGHASGHLGGAHGLVARLLVGRASKVGQPLGNDAQTHFRGVERALQVAFLFVQLQQLLLLFFLGQYDLRTDDRGFFT